jgi:hypothetical protein
MLAVYLGACSMGLPEKISVRASPALDLPLGDYEYPKAEGKFIDIADLRETLGQDVIYDYKKPGVDTQVFLIHYRQELDEFKFDMNEYDFRVDDALELEEVQFDIPDLEALRQPRDINLKLHVEEFSDHLKEQLTLHGGKLPAGTYSGIPIVSEKIDIRDQGEKIEDAFVQAVIREGYIDIEAKPGMGYSLDLSGLKIKLYENSNAADVSATLENPVPQGGGTYRFLLNDKTVYRDTAVQLGGSVILTLTADHDPADGLPIEVTSDISSLSSVTMTVEEKTVEERIDMDFPPGVKSVTFDKIGALLKIDLSHPVDGLALAVTMNFYTAGNSDPAFEFKNTVRIDMPDNLTEEISRFISIAQDGADVTIGDEHTPLWDIVSAEITVTVNPQENNGDRKLTVRDLRTADTEFSVKAGAAADFEIARAVLDLNQFIPADYNSSSFPKDSDDKVFSFSDFTGSLGENININNLYLDEITLSVYLRGLDDVEGAPALGVWDTRPGLRLIARDREDKDDPGVEIAGNIIVDSGDSLDGYEELSAGDKTIDFPPDSNVFTGELPPANFRTRKLTDFFNTKPEDMAIEYQFKFGNDFSIEWASLKNGEIARNIVVDLVVELPMRLRLMEDDEPGYGSLTYSFYKDGEDEKDLFGREPDAEDPYGDYLKYLDFASVELGYRNTLGLYGVELVIRGKNSDFEKTVGPLASEGTINLTLRGDEIPSRFIPQMVVRVPVDPPPIPDDAPADPYGRRYGIINVRRITGDGDNPPAQLCAFSIRVKAQTYIEEEFPL